MPWVRRIPVYRVRQAFVEHGLEAALFRKEPTGRVPQTGWCQEAQLIALACRRTSRGGAS